MPPELMELYNLYKQELETRNRKENQFVEDLNNEIIRVSFKTLKIGRIEFFSVNIHITNLFNNTGTQYDITSRTRN